jgi:N-acyl-L-homoserine lactone synthetase
MYNHQYDQTNAYDSLSPACSSYLECGFAFTEERYIARRLDVNDEIRHTEYQHLRAEVFVHSLGWDIPLDQFGRERDHYDESSHPGISVHCIYQKNHLLGGVRIFELNDWEDSMTFHEFHRNGMVPDTALEYLRSHYTPQCMLELTRLCIRRNKLHRHENLDHSKIRDYVYATAYVVGKKTQRMFALAIVDRLYFLACKRANFVFDVIYQRNFQQKDGFALVVVDFEATIRAIQIAGNAERARRILSLC